MSGAAALAGLAALRGGAGLVQVAVPANSLASVAAIEPSYLTASLPEDEAGRMDASAAATLEPLIAVADAVAIGPGLGRSAVLDQLVPQWYRDIAAPAVFDADALNALAAFQDWPPPAGYRVLTPHPGEFARLLGESREAVQAHRASAAKAFAARRGVILVLKGTQTLITNGQQLAVNPSGNPGMATGGTGDVLTGLICALLAQGMSPYDAARLGVFLHGLAGDLAAEELGQISLIASDLVRFLPAAFRIVQR